MKLNLGIQSLHFETPLGNTLSALYEHYTSGIPAFSFDPVHQLLTSPFPYSNEEIHKVLGSPLRALSFADRSTLLTLLALKNIDNAAALRGARCHHRGLHGARRKPAPDHRRGPPRYAR